MATRHAEFLLFYLVFRLLEAEDSLIRYKEAIEFPGTFWVEPVITCSVDGADRFVRNVDTIFVQFFNH